MGRWDRRMLIVLLVLVAVPIGLLVLFEPTPPSVTSIRFGPDSNTLALTYEVATCPATPLLYHISDQSTETLIPRAGETWFEVTVSPDGNSLAFVSSRLTSMKWKSGVWEESRLVVVNRDEGDIQYISPTDYQVGFPTFDSSGKKIIFITRLKSKANMSAHLSGQIKISQDGISHLHDERIEQEYFPRYGVNDIDIRTGEITTLIPAEFWRISRAVPTSNGRYLYFIGAISKQSKIVERENRERHFINNGLFRYDYSTKEIVLMREILLATLVAGNPSIDKSGTMLAYLKKSNRFWSSVIVSDPRSETDGSIFLTEPNMIDLAVSPDGTTLAFLSDAKNFELTFPTQLRQYGISVAHLNKDKVLRLGIPSLTFAQSMRPCRFYLRSY